MKDKKIDYCGKGIYEQIKNIKPTKSIQFSIKDIEEWISKIELPKSKVKGMMSGYWIKYYCPNKFEHLEDNKLYIVEL